MGRCAQALISGGLIHRCEGFGRVQMFGTADADAEAEDDDVGDGEDGEETAEGDESKRKKPRKSDVRPPDDAV